DYPPKSSREVKEVQEPTDDESPDLSSLRDELNDQFESIRIIEPGQYELNLMELYNREEYIIALQENGRYMIEVPDTWQESDS
ncbi:MAG: Zn-ribbon containing protein, partial [Halobacteriaceae archaeon]